jgi:hypothetical protein
MKLVVDELMVEKENKLDFTTPQAAIYPAYATIGGTFPDVLDSSAASVTLTSKNNNEWEAHQSNSAVKEEKIMTYR